MTPKPSKAMIILDSSFLIWLEHFENFCRTTKAPWVFTQGRTPLCALDHLIAKGCTLVIPNEVLKDMTNTFTDGTEQRRGIGITTSGKLYIANSALPTGSPFTKKAPHFCAWLRQHNGTQPAESNITFFSNGGAFAQAHREGQLIPGLVVVADQQVKQGTGGEACEYSRRCKASEKEIVALSARLDREMGEKLPTLLLSKNKDLMDAVNHEALHPDWVTVFPGYYHSLMVVSGFNSINENAGPIPSHFCDALPALEKASRRSVFQRVQDFATDARIFDDRYNGEMLDTADGIARAATPATTIERPTATPVKARDCSPPPASPRATCAVAHKTPVPAMAPPPAAEDVGGKNIAAMFARCALPDRQGGTARGNR